MRRTCVALAVLLAGLVQVLASAQSHSDDLMGLYRSRQWFDLRGAISDQSPELVRGAVASAFNEPEVAERLLLGVIRSRQGSTQADDAYAMLSRLYIRSGQYRRFLESYKQWASAFPNSSQLKDEQENVRKFEGRPDQLNGTRRRSLLKHELTSLTVPVVINGRTDNFLFDTGAWQSAMTEPEARKLGLVVRDETRTLTGSTGQTATFRTAVVNELTIGTMRFRNVSFAVISAVGLMRDVEMGLIGMPILLALGSIHWSTDGTVELGGAVQKESGNPNLVFDRHRLLLQLGVLNRQVLTTFDTGANTTDLNTNFATLFKDVVEERGKRGKQDSTGVGGTQTFDSIELPELAFTIGSRSVVLRPAYITLQQLEIIGGECCVGNAGNDLLTQGQGFTLDFSGMALRLR